MFNFLMRIFESVFGCQHAALSRVFTVKSRSYKVCYDCGREFNYSLAQMKMASRPVPATTVPCPEVRQAATHEVVPVRVMGRVRA